MIKSNEMRKELPTPHAYAIHAGMSSVIKLYSNPFARCSSASILRREWKQTFLLFTEAKVDKAIFGHSVFMILTYFPILIMYTMRTCSHHSAYNTIEENWSANERTRPIIIFNTTNEYDESRMLALSFLCNLLCTRKWIFDKRQRNRQRE